MTRKEQIKILDDKIKSNINQYKTDRLNAEISALSSGDLNKYEFLTRKDLKYKPNALDKAKFEFSPLGKTFSTGLDKTAEGYQEEGVIKLLKDIRDGLAGGANRPNNRPNRFNDDNNDDNDDDNNDDNNNDNNDDNADMPDLETEEEAAERIADFYEQEKESKTSDDDKIKKLKDRILYLEAKRKDSKLSIEGKDKLYEELIKSNDKLEDFIELYDDIVKEEQNKIYNRSNKFKDKMKNIMNNLEKANDILDKSNDRLDKLNDNILKIKKVLNEKKMQLKMMRL